MPITNAPTAGADDTLAVWDVQQTVHRLLVEHDIGPDRAGAPDSQVLDGWTRTVVAAIDDVHRQLVGKVDRTHPSWRLAADAVALALHERQSLPWHVRQGDRIDWRKSITDRALDLAAIAARITVDHRASTRGDR